MKSNFHTRVFYYEYFTTKSQPPQNKKASQSSVKKKGKLSIELLNVIDKPHHEVDSGTFRLFQFSNKLKIKTLRY